MDNEINNRTCEVIKDGRYCVFLNLVTRTERISMSRNILRDNHSKLGSLLAQQPFLIRVSLNILRLGTLLVTQGLQPNWVVGTRPLSPVASALVCFHGSFSLELPSLLFPT